MTDQAQAPSHRDFEAFLTKLAALRETLPVPEQRMLDAIILTACESPDEVAGFQTMPDRDELMSYLPTRVHWPRPHRPNVSY
jgi:hypothetical protein